MCGIAGIFAYQYAASPINKDELRKIRDYMTARGPDGHGEWYSQDHRIGLAHRRLAIIDLSENGKQPMLSQDQQLVISFNGEIYNYKELKQELEKKGAHFTSHSDTEIILQLYQYKGIAMLEDLRGMFAFALWDQTKQALLLARDPYGIKPLYYADDGWTVRFASQVKALITSPKISKDKSPAAQVGFYLFGSIPEPYTLYKDIRCLPAGHYTWIDTTGAHIPSSYFSISHVFRQAWETKASYNQTEIQAQASQAIKDSIKYHLIADVPVGAFLSSGIDSGALVGIMQEYQTQPLKTLTLTFEEFKNKPYDEAPLAKQLADYYQVQHHSHILTEEKFKEYLPTILQDMDQPSIDGINTWLVSKATRELGLKVALSGLGGDELFGGYPSFHNISRWQQYFSLISYIPFLPYLSKNLFNLFLAPYTSLNPKLAGLIQYSRHLYSGYFLQRGLFMPWELPHLLDKETIETGLSQLNFLQSLKQAISPDPQNNFACIASLEASFYMRNQLLRDSDWASMAHSLEIRVPLVDAHLLKTLAPLLITPNNHKSLLANTPAKPLPEYITQRKKTGFTIPIQDWLKNHTELDHWRKIPLLKRKNCHWSRKFAYTIMEAL